MFLFKKRNGYYYAVYNNDEGKRVFLSTKSKNKSEAYEFFSNLKQEIKNRRLNKIIPISIQSPAYPLNNIARHCGYWLQKIQH